MNWTESTIKCWVILVDLSCPASSAVDWLSTDFTQISELKVQKEKELKKTIWKQMVSKLKDDRTHLGLKIFILLQILVFSCQILENK